MGSIRRRVTRARGHWRPLITALRSSMLISFEDNASDDAKDDSKGAKKDISGPQNEATDCVKIGTNRRCEKRRTPQMYLGVRVI